MNILIKKITKIPVILHDIIESKPRESAKHDYKVVFQKLKQDISKFINIPLEKTSILILGCGYNYPEVIFFSKVADEVIGLDIIKSFYRDGIIRTFKEVRKTEKNLIKTLFNVFFKKCFYNRYYQYLTNRFGIKINHKKYQLFTYDGNKIPFEDEKFDIVLSNAVFEHIDNVEKVIQEIYRVTKKDGISYHIWHNYYSFSGGHKSEYLSLKHPWGHLRKKYETSNLNKLTPEEIKDCFSKYFKIVEFCGMDKEYRKKCVDKNFQFEKEFLLKGKIKKELNAFSEELLLTRAYLIVGEKYV